MMVESHSNKVCKFGFVIGLIWLAVFFAKNICQTTPDGAIFPFLLTSENINPKTELFAVAQRCLTKHVHSTAKGDLWQTLNGIISKCCKTVGEVLRVEFLNNTDESKGFIDYTDLSLSKNCTLITVGIGNDIEAERKLLSRVPGCLLYGADPIFTTGQVYKQIGQLFTLGILDKRINSTALVADNHAYHRRIIEHVGFVEFIQNYAGISHVDFLFLDAEGAEYKILPLLSTGGAVDRAGITICQWSVELHGPVSSYHLTLVDWDSLIRNLLLKSPYIPLWSEVAHGHYRIFFAHIKNPYCSKRFFS